MRSMLESAQNYISWKKVDVNWTQAKMMSGHVYYQSQNMRDSASQIDDDWLCPAINGDKEKEIPKSICSALHSSELEAVKKSNSDQENMSDSESQSEDDNDSLIFSGNNGEDIDEFLFDIDMLVLDEWNEKFKERDQLDHYKSKESYDLLLNHLSEYPRLIAKNEECDYRKAVSELRFRYGEPQTVVNEDVECIEFRSRKSIINQPNPHPDSGDFSRAEAINDVRFELNNLKQMAARDEIYRKLIQDDPKIIDRIVSLMPEKMEARFVDDVLKT